MNNILTTMRSIDEERSLVQRVVDDGNDEVHQVAVNFNELLDRIEELVKTVESEQEQKRETQFQLLQAQINPHFLFNTLNTPVSYTHLWTLKQRQVFVHNRKIHFKML